MKEFASQAEKRRHDALLAEKALPPIVHTFEVDRTKWYRGHGADHSALLRPDGKMCCVGFLAKSCGLKDEQILCKPTIASIVNGLDGPSVYFTEGGEKVLTEPSVELEELADVIKWMALEYVGVYGTNDASPHSDFDEHDRERQVCAFFRKRGIEVKFVN